MGGQPGYDGRKRGARAIALPGARSAGENGALGLLRAARGWFAAHFAEEIELGRPALWFPVAFGVGVIVYFAAAEEPQLWAAGLLAGAAVMGVVAARRRFIALGVALGLAAGAFGFLAAKIAAVRAEAPQLARAQRAEVVGRVVLIEPRDRGMRRVTVAVERLGDLKASGTPRRMRVTIGREPSLDAGDRLALTAFWRAPQGPVRPGGYDFARVAFFQGVGATGSQPKDVRRLAPAAEETAPERVSAAVERLRARLTERVVQAIGGGPEAAVAAALVTGVRGPIPQDVDDDLRAAGLSHILSISGLHMALVAGVLFWLVRAALALSQTAALGWPVKQIAAVAALGGAAFYLALSGAEVATQRAFLMAAVVFAAILIGRPALTLRNLALAALAVTALTPDALLGPSFQMSFAAVAALIATFEAWPRRRERPEPTTRLGAAIRWLGTAAAVALVTTLVAGLATAPFAAYHFHRVTPYALAGNALATPLISLIVMPSVVGGLLFAPLGLDGPWWRLMGLGLEGVLAIARAVASWPGAERATGAFGEASLVLFALGICWLCLWRTALRFLAVAPILAALALAAWPTRPDVVIDPAGRSIAVRGPDGKLALVGAGRSGFAAKVWVAADGEEPPGTSSGARRAVGAGRCDAYGCVAPLGGGGVAALVWDPRAFEEDCRRATLVVTRLEAPPACFDRAAVVDRRALAATGALELKRDGLRFVGTAARTPGSDRPWSPAGLDPPPDDALRLQFAPRRAPTSAASDAVDPTDDPDEPDERAAEDDQ
ncbi:ComEC/Rec2 family competence protein [Methylopila turkensis]|uniref:Competence protein ComEC n=1 Tax=Methylopila turkensis TaxID=1437816 RepID=A0A9W6JPJ8_9HYPH|nr:ComEC/Rec2 family competence protein [Methylopila turkensis]GLK80917.1 competence protein ComEC [Methylopila turkensis]